MKTESCVKIETREVQTEAKLILQKSVKIYCSTILNNNRKDDILCGRIFTVENGQSIVFYYDCKCKILSKVTQSFLTRNFQRFELDNRSREHHNEEDEISLYSTGLLIGWI